MIKKISAGKSFLNLFSYTSAASVYAAAGGAKLTVSVDANPNYCGWAERNFLLNSFSAGTNRVVVSDCIEYLKNEKSSYDIIFVDPPTFSNSRGRSNDFDLQRDHPELLVLACEKLEANGIIIFSNNFKKFKLDDNIDEIFQVEDITEKTVSPDFSRRGYARRCWVLTKKQ
jgi:23S rRNA (guanine2445-N2)-methyltransferase / 23S rRNA (guanine2069-N7)-methyltransferase